MTTSPIWKHRFLILLRLARKAFYKSLGVFNKKLQPRQAFYIKAGYHHATTAETFDATGSTDEFQRTVYELASSIAETNNFKSVIDVGCGSAYKLIHMLGRYDTIGIEVEPAYGWLKQKYPDRHWILFNADGMTGLQSDLVICSDVIEHIANPNDMMNFLQSINFNLLVLSTPERDRIAGKSDYGPPENTSHYREWNTKEFELFVSNWFNIQEHHVFDDRSITQVVVCSKK
jgi:hypothetical protein